MTTAITSLPVPSAPASAEPGMIMNLSLGNINYKVYAYYENAQGTRTYLPSTLDGQAMEKIRTLAWGLANAHDCRNRSANESPYEIKNINSQGLIKADNALVTHNFNIEPITSETFQNQIAETISQTSQQPIQASAIKAQDIWNALDLVARQQIGSIQTPPQPLTNQSPPIINNQTPVITTNTPPQTTPISLQTPPQPLTNQSPPITNNQPPAITTNTPPQTAPLSHQAPLINNLPQQIANPVQAHVARYQPPLDSVELDLRGLDYDQPDWYERIRPRQKLRIATDLTKHRTMGGIIYQKVWKHFEDLTHISPTRVFTIELLEKERDQLSRTCMELPTQIERSTRRQANQIIENFYLNPSQHQFRQEMIDFVSQEVELKEQLFQRIREQALAEGILIEEWDRLWAQYHYMENGRIFVQALAGWLDNN